MKFVISEKLKKYNYYADPEIERCPAHSLIIESPNNRHTAIIPNLYARL
jgi:hypothetical protein